jgi:hypothetical protein
VVCVVLDFLLIIYFLVSLFTCCSLTLASLTRLDFLRWCVKLSIHFGCRWDLTLGLGASPTMRNITSTGKMLPRRVRSLRRSSILTEQDMPMSTPMSTPSKTYSFHTSSPHILHTSLSFSLGTYLFTKIS